MKKQFKKSLVALAITAMMATSAMAQNIGFEDGTTTGWGGNGVSAVGTQTLQAGPNQWTINPYGNYMGMLSINSGSFSQMTSALNLTSNSTAGIQSTLTTQAQTTGNGQGNPTTASWASKTVTLTAGQTFTLAWQYISTDYVPFNDGSIATLVKVGSPTTTAVLNNYSSQYALLGFTNPGTGDYSTGSYGATGWQTATYNVTDSGDYLLGFGVFNLDDTALSPVLYVDEVTGTTLQNGQTFGAVAPNPGTSAPDTSIAPVTPPTPPAVTVTGTSSSTGTSTSTVSRGTGLAIAVATIGITSSIDAVTRGPSVTSTAEDRARGLQGAKTLSVNQTITTTVQTPVTTVTTATTPITTVTTTTTPVTTTTQTPVTTVTTYSDGTTSSVTTTTTTTSTVNEVVSETAVSEVVATSTALTTDIQASSATKVYSTSIDQYEYLQKANQRFNQQLDSNPLDRHSVSESGITSKTGNDDREGWAYIIADGQKTNTNGDGYSMTARRFGVGYEKAVERNLLVGAQFNNIESTLYGTNAGGSLNKNAVGIYSLYTVEDWILKSDVGFAVNDYSNSHAIPELQLSNNGKTSGQDMWINNRLYTPSVEGFRPFVGARVENNQITGLTESGSSLTAMSYNKVNQTNTTGEAGVRYEHKLFDQVNLVAEAGQNTNSLATLKAGASYSPDKNVLGTVNVGQQRQNGVVNNILQAAVKLFF